MSCLLMGHISRVKNVLKFCAAFIQNYLLRSHFYCLGDIKSLFKKNKEGRNLTSFAAKSLTQGFWATYRSCLPF